MLSYCVYTIMQEINDIQFHEPIRSFNSLTQIGHLGGSTRHQYVPFKELIIKYLLFRIMCARTTSHVTFIWFLCIATDQRSTINIYNNIIHHTVLLLTMPLADPNKLLVPSKIPLFRGRKPTCTRDITQKTANTTDSDDILALSRQQKSALVDLALFRFAEAQAGKRFSPEEEVHSTFLAKSSIRRELGAFTNALVEGMVCNVLHVANFKILIIFFS